MALSMKSALGVAHKSRTVQAAGSPLLRARVQRTPFSVQAVCFTYSIENLAYMISPFGKLSRVSISYVHKNGAPTMQVFGRAKQAKVTKRETITPEPSFNLQLGLLGLSGLSIYENNYVLGGFLGFLGVFLAIQATRIRFAFDDEAMEVLRAGKESDNVIVGGRNRWEYSSFINWEMWWPGFPVLVYFKENKTKPEGQVHFFPIIFNGKQLYDVMVERCGPSKNSGPKN
ncbi:hypothetical protein PLESTB_000365300 [Pleodorina starrii]|uniref:DUF3119 family protein n=1 Tax=Pleodorina starrii TaxID=330485 RepID=A0A9W6BDU4_9CHLO|nr:hypothetical protein PLESTB_000365300 [Pleodorina starrii]GLC64304.1 hypothetical protein PLESTF_000147300 [Pleodorina starrii]